MVRAVSIKLTWKVAPLVGAWIEILRIFSNSLLNAVAPLVGAWIEIFSQSTPF